MAAQHVDLTEHKALAKKHAAESGPVADSGPTHALLRLQAQVGNSQVARLLAQRAGEEDELAASHDMAQRAGEEDELAMSRDPALQRAGEEDELAMSRDDESIGVEGGAVGKVVVVP